MSPGADGGARPGAGDPGLIRGHQARQVRAPLRGIVRIRPFGDEGVALRAFPRGIPEVGERAVGILLSPAWVHRLALGLCTATFLLIVVGGLVTNTGAALAVPDWPTTFGYNMFLFPWSEMVGGVFYEHSHRLLGAGVGLLTVALAVMLWIAEGRRWVRWLGVATVFAVAVQGVLGGLRVVLVEDGIAVVHGALAQAFFGLTVGLALFTSPSWAGAAPTPAAHAPLLRRLALLTTGGGDAQIVLGAVVS